MSEQIKLVCWPSFIWGGTGHVVSCIFMCVWCAFGCVGDRKKKNVMPHAGIFLWRCFTFLRSYRSYNIYKGLGLVRILQNSILDWGRFDIQIIYWFQRRKFKNICMIYFWFYFFFYKSVTVLTHYTAIDIDKMVLMVLYGLCHTGTMFYFLEYRIERTIRGPIIVRYNSK